MPFVTDLFVYSSQLVELDSVPKLCRKTINCKEELLAFPWLISDPMAHPLNHEGPSIAIAIANNVLFIDCTERFARGLGITFAKMNKYSGKNGSLPRVFFKLSIQKHYGNARFHFAVERLFRGGGEGGGEGIQVIVPSDTAFVCPEHSLNINSPQFPGNEKDIFLWSSLVTLNCKHSKHHFESTIDYASQGNVHVYRFKNCFFTPKYIEQIIDNHQVVCVVGISADAVIKFTDHSLPSTNQHCPASFALYRKPECGSVRSINYV